jgi:protein-S-isoprenylcysteine O-methyltransferase Ste14
MRPPFLHFSPFRWLGILLIAARIPLLLDSFARFALKGLERRRRFSLQHLVVSGLCRYVRNPMYLAVVAVILGQGLLLGDVRVLEWSMEFWSASVSICLFCSMRSRRCVAALGLSMKTFALTLGAGFPA